METTNQYYMNELPSTQMYQASTPYSQKTPENITPLYNNYQPYYTNAYTHSPYLGQFYQAPKYYQHDQTKGSLNSSYSDFNSDTSASRTSYTPESLAKTASSPHNTSYLTGMANNLQYSHLFNNSSPINHAVYSAVHDNSLAYNNLMANYADYSTTSSNSLSFTPNQSINDLSARSQKRVDSDVSSVHASGPVKITPELMSIEGKQSI